MNLLSVENISKSYGELVLFEQLSFGVNKDQKIALIAKNGSGKTAILNILSGLDQPDQGMVNYRKDIKVSFLAQEPILAENSTIEQCILASDNEVLKVIANYEKALLDMDNADGYQKAFDAMDRHAAWDFETQYQQILSKLKLDDLQLKVSALSGGQKKRVALANALLNKPDLLILDEPTNHLDLEMIEWLEVYFAKENITLFMVTHDRYFLERVCNEIVELDQGQLYTYKGNYAYYLEKKEARLSQEQVEQHKSKRLFKKELDWMRRQPKARTTKSKSRIDDFAQIKERAHQRRQDHEIQLEIDMERMGTKILECHKLFKSFGDKSILDGFDYNFLRGERIGIIGKNGTGKSTFLNILTGKESVDGGKIVVGDTIKFGYYTQDGIPSKSGQKVIDVIREFGDYIPLKKGRQISAQQLLERFLFDRKKQYDFVEKLSGGERKRLYLCTVLIQNPNFLILDEPTNDLDIVTLNVLESFLLDYPGCLLVVSHDRYFMDKIVDHLFVFRGAGYIEDFPGNYSDFRAYEDSQDQEQEPIKPKSIQQQTAAKTATTTQKQKISFNEQKEYQQLESKIRSLEKDKLALEQSFFEEGLSVETIEDRSKKLQEVIETIELKTMRWFELAAKIEG
ncbi:MAG: ABC-F family ATP-binding cassette domain-containing protein [Flavobacteriaceae bacterium]|jgi:ATP-binding cassette subfamily F protein uup|nr:ABC-F family ATP-binding cassette domain-containing protein [Flavobacteriaceae bacterium]MBT5585580.1 ABC-F family ATP-binding cassette domain-containing protein [Flavobacteriaceae bacterium]MBT5920948.1 ABC-F family ATP-binding cassette domain-containing protein [Flavobacteriaceae bacterium]MDA9888954.1 ABC-F family ATP-binding cassette domain-containing protein [Flavobacteriaceae bacterium]MDB4031678.1 ABC-F family ATP-binding cassette domain-containing protein [Flavobacteriaceae bacterium|tara:strand:- start:303 stop:2180 length:1878 start_codon:yes stop_codon:yes gene_type:complete